MAEWIYFIHPPRENFAATMTEEEKSVWSVHFERFKRLLTEDVIVLVGPTLGIVNPGIAIFEAPDETTARKIMNEDPVIAGGVRPRRTPGVPDLAAARTRLKHLPQPLTYSHIGI